MELSTGQVEIVPAQSEPTGREWADFVLIPGKIAVTTSLLQLCQITRVCITPLCLFFYTSRILLHSGGSPTSFWGGNQATGGLHIAVFITELFVTQMLWPYPLQKGIKLCVRKLCKVYTLSSLFPGSFGFTSYIQVEKNPLRVFETGRYNEPIGLARRPQLVRADISRTSPSCCLVAKHHDA